MNTKTKVRTLEYPLLNVWLELDIPGVRYYDKSKIEEEIEELRSSGGREFWRETKRSIKVRRGVGAVRGVVTRARQDARYRLSLQRNSLHLVGTMADTLQLSKTKSRSLPSSGSQTTGGVLLSAALILTTQGSE